jgi:hypothetical protein
MLATGWWRVADRVDPSGRVTVSWCGSVVVVRTRGFRPHSIESRALPAVASMIIQRSEG